jgi:broad-specificity NMP kinase
MILFINGPFGVGKTSVARVLVQKMPHSMLDDPEVVGRSSTEFSVPSGRPKISRTTPSGGPWSSEACVC